MISILCGTSGCARRPSITGLLVGIIFRRRVTLLKTLFAILLIVIIAILLIVIIAIIDSNDSYSIFRRIVR